jgi:threonine dehydrogenase-like Zn-dependent dehydrogenase
MSPDERFLDSLLEPISNAIEAYKEFDRREPGWVKVELRPQVH